jgi:hypothetical protein
MKAILSTEKIPIMLWLDDIEEGALQQAKNLVMNSRSSRSNMKMPWSSWEH